MRAEGVGKENRILVLGNMTYGRDAKIGSKGSAL